MALCRYYPLLGLIFWECLCIPGTAQTLYVEENQQVYVSENTVVTLGSGLRNKGILTNRGTIQVFGDWINEREYTAGSNSEVILSDRGTQQIDQRGQAFYRLLVAGGGTKNLLSEARVSGTLTLTDGIVAPTSEAPLTLEATATVAESSDASYVESSMRYEGDGARTFPLGLDGNYLPITLTNVTASPTLQVSVKAPHPAGTPGEDVEAISSSRYWEVVPIQGTFEGSRVILTVTADDGLEDLLGAVVVQSDQLGGVYSNLGQSAQDGDATQGSITSKLPLDQPFVAVGLTNQFSLENQVLVPSAFAPGAPNPENQVLKIFATTLLSDSFSFRIFDRWGTLIYHTTSLQLARDEGWNGLRQSDQSPAPSGVYQYHLQGIFESSTPVNQSGTITLFR